MSRKRLGLTWAVMIAGLGALWCAPQRAAAATNLALGKAVLVSSSEVSSNVPANAVDGNTSTRWSSGYSDNEWITVDLGSSQSINAVTLRWEAAYARSFRIQTSSDNVNWATQYFTSSGTGGTVNIPLATVSARYVRMLGVQRATTYGYSLWEFEVYGPGVGAGGNLALNKALTVSSVDDSSHAGAYAVDGKLSTRWSSAYSNPQWISVDLGSAQTIGSVVLRWEAAYGRAYQIQTSSDNRTWTTRYSTTAGAGGTETVTFTPVSARYVRMYGTQRGTVYGFSLWEIEVYGTGGGGTGGSTGPDLTGFSLLRDYRFGTGSDRNVRNLSELATNFKPYANLAGQTVINGEWQVYQNFRDANHHFTADRLELTAKADLGGVRVGGISSGQITTKETFYPSGGKTYVFQLRAKIPRGTGTWPAFWMYAGADPHTDSEIDIFEFFDTPTQNTFDWTGYDHGDANTTDYHNIMTNEWVWHPGIDFAADYHTYTLVWKEGDIQKWVDNNWVKGSRFTWSGSAPQIIINLAIGGADNNNPTAATFPAVFSLDSLKVWVK